MPSRRSSRRQSAASCPPSPPRVRRSSSCMASCMFIPLTLFLSYNTISMVGLAYSGARAAESAIAASSSSSFVKRPLIREDLNAIQYQSQEANTHLLHQMVHHGTILRGGGHSRQTITRSKKAMVIHQSTTHMGSSSDSEYRASESILNRANTTGKVGYRTEPLLNVLVLGNKVWIFLCKN